MHDAISAVIPGAKNKAHTAQANLKASELEALFST